MAKNEMGFFAHVHAVCVACALTLGLLLSAAVPALAEDAPAAVTPDYSGFEAQEGISAVVNDKLISNHDLNQRIKLIMVTSGIPETDENKQRIAPQVLRSLVDEQLESQEANRLDIKVDDKDVQSQIESIARRANMTMDEIESYLKENDVSMSTLIDQIRSELAWNKVANQQFAPLITVSEEEITDVLTRLNEEADQPRYLISEILLTYDNPQQEQELMAGAARLAEQMRQGAPFSSVAQQFSRSASAANGGDIGWVHLSQLPEDVAAVVGDMGIGAISAPIRTLNGIYLIQLRSKQVGVGSDPMRDEWTVMRVVLTLTPDAPPAAVERRVKDTQRFVKEFKSCAEIPAQLKSYIGGQADAPATYAFGGLDPRLQQALSKRKPGDLLPPSRSEVGIEMVAICDHKVAAGQLPTRDSIEDNLFSQQLSMMSRRHLRDLRRDAVIEMR